MIVFILFILCSLFFGFLLTFLNSYFQGLGYKKAFDKRRKNDV